MLLSIRRSGKVIEPFDVFCGEFFTELQTFHGEYKLITEGRCVRLHAKYYRYKALFGYGLLKTEVVFLSTDPDICYQKNLCFKDPKIYIIYKKYINGNDTSILIDVVSCKRLLGISSLTILEYLSTVMKKMYNVGSYDNYFNDLCSREETPLNTLETHYIVQLCMNWLYDSKNNDSFIATVLDDAILELFSMYSSNYALDVKHHMNRYYKWDQNINKLKHRRTANAINHPMINLESSQVNYPADEYFLSFSNMFESLLTHPSAEVVLSSNDNSRFNDQIFELISNTNSADFVELIKTDDEYLTLKTYQEGQQVYESHIDLIMYVLSCNSIINPKLLNFEKENIHI